MEGYSELSREAIREKITDREENFTLIEVGPKAEYENAHLPHAINMALGDIDLLVRRLIPNKWEDIVVYGGGETGDASVQAATLLVSMGYKDVKRYVGGKADWISSGLPVEGAGHHGKVA